MKKVITAIGNPIVNEKLKIEKSIEVIGKDIQYQEGIFEILEKENNIDFLILSEIISGDLNFLQLIEKVQLKNKNIRIIVVLENKNEELENLLISKGIFKILYHNQVEIKEIIQLLNITENKENEDLKEEINNLKKLIIENNSKNQKQNKEEIKEKNQNKLNSKISLFISKKIQKNKLLQKFNSNKFQTETKNKTEIISISGPSGVGKSIITVNLAKVISYEKEKVLMIDFDILNNSLHTILGVKKYPVIIERELKKSYIKELNINNLKTDQFINKINKNIDLISATDLLFGTKEKIDIIKIERIFNELKEKYNTIIIDTSSECFFDFTKTIIKMSNKNIFVTETNILEIKKAKELLNIYINEWKISKDKFNILFNKYDKECINMNLLKNIFSEFNIIGTLKYNSKYNKLINKNIINLFHDKKIRNEYLNIKNHI